MRTFVYLRVSTTDQKTDSQKSEIVAWLGQHGLSEQQVRWFVDKETGKTLSRPAMSRLREEIDRGEVETVIVQRFDRISRRLIDGLTLLADWAERGIRIVAVKQQVDLSGAVGRLVAAVLLGVAEMELELRRERQAAGIEVARRLGKYRGRRKGATKVNPIQAVRLHERGLTPSEIAKALGISRSSVRKYLKGNRCSNSSPLRTPTTLQSADGSPLSSASSTSCILSR